MPHISKTKLNKEVTKDLERYITSIIKDPGTKTRAHIFQELLTPTEKIMLAKRLGIILLSEKNMSLYKISEQLGVSSSTVARFQNGMQKRKYNYTVKWLWKQTNEGFREDLLQSLASLVFTGKIKSFKKFVEEY